jgi:hypothetical protein
MLQKKRKPRRVKYIFPIFVGVVILSYIGIFGLFLAAPSSEHGVGNPPRLGYAAPTNTMYRKPPLENYIQGWNITGNVSWLLDFAIVGFPKTGTSTLMFYLENQTDSVFTFPDERCELGWNQHVPLLRELYKNYQPHLRMGIKCPRDLEVSLALNNYNQFFRTTKFVIGLRNPVKWFESFYNFRITNEFEMPPVHRLVGKCKRFSWGVCTDRANFSQHLAKIEPWRNLFLYDIAQLKDANTTRAQQFRDDLGQFLNLRKPLTDPMIWIKPGQAPESAERAKELDAMKINICDERFESFRGVLNQHASESSTWIQETFLKNPHVHVSSRDHFVRLVDAWHSDACNPPA